MTIAPNGEIRIDTLGDLLDDDYGISWFCEGRCKGRRLNLTLERAIEIWGRDRCHIAQTWTGIKCSECGGTKIGISLTAPRYSREQGR